MEVIFPLLIILISFAVSASKNKKNAQTAKNAGQSAARQAAARQAAARQAAARRAPRNAGIPNAGRTAAQRAPETKSAPAPTLAAEEDEAWEHGGGSIELPPVEAHEHEGKPMPCPAEEREKPRPRPSQLAPKETEQKPQGLQLSFSQSSLVQAAVMSEILRRPQFRNGRRVIR